MLVPQRWLLSASRTKDSRKYSRQAANNGIGAIEQRESGEWERPDEIDNPGLDPTHASRNAAYMRTDRD